MNTFVLKLDEVRRCVKHPRDYTVADWFMVSTVSIVVVAAAFSKVIS